MSKLFYRTEMTAAEEGLVLITKVFVSIRETEKMHFCVVDHHHRRLLNPVLGNPNEPLIDAAKRKKYKIYRVHKQGSRIASPTEDAAFDSLLYRKRKQVRHLQINLAVVGKFLELAEGKQLTEFPKEPFHDFIQRTIPDTVDFVCEHYCFN